MQPDAPKTADELITEHFQWARKIGRSVCRTKRLKDDCESIGTETLMEVARKYASGQIAGLNDIESFLKYVSTSIGNAVKRHLGREKRRYPSEWQAQSDPEKGESTAAQRLEDTVAPTADEEIAVGDLIKLLTDSERLVADAMSKGRAVGKDIETIAGELDKPIWWVREKEWSGFEKLRSHLEENQVREGSLMWVGDKPPKSS